MLFGGKMAFEEVNTRILSLGEDLKKCDSLEGVKETADLISSFSSNLLLLALQRLPWIQS